MDKNTSIAFILIGIILVTWLYFNSPAPQPPQKKKSDTTAVEKKDTLSTKEAVKQKKILRLGKNLFLLVQKA